MRGVGGVARCSRCDGHRSRSCCSARLPRRRLCPMPHASSRRRPRCPLALGALSRFCCPHAAPLVWAVAAPVLRLLCGPLLAASTLAGAVRVVVPVPWCAGRRRRRLRWAAALDGCLHHRRCCAGAASPCGGWAGPHSGGTPAHACGAAHVPLAVPFAACGRIGGRGAPPRPDGVLHRGGYRVWPVRRPRLAHCAPLGCACRGRGICRRCSGAARRCRGIRRGGTPRGGLRPLGARCGMGAAAWRCAARPTVCGGVPLPVAVPPAARVWCWCTPAQSAGTHRGDDGGGRPARRPHVAHGAPCVGSCGGGHSRGRRDGVCCRGAPRGGWGALRWRCGMVASARRAAAHALRFASLHGGGGCAALRRGACNRRHGAGSCPVRRGDVRGHPVHAPPAAGGAAASGASTPYARRGAGGGGLAGACRGVGGCALPQLAVAAAAATAVAAAAAGTTWPGPRGRGGAPPCASA